METICNELKSFLRLNSKAIILKVFSGLRPKGLINEKLNKNVKELTIISSSIKTGENKEKKCFEANIANFPDLILRYKKLYRTLNPLRAKLDLPPNTDLKPICN